MSRAGQIYSSIHQPFRIPIPFSGQAAPNAKHRRGYLEVQAERSGYELHTFVCPNCDHLETAVGTAA